MQRRKNNAQNKIVKNSLIYLFQFPSTRKNPPSSFKSINSDVIIACIDAFFPTVDKPTVIVMDQASIHTSNAIFDKIEEWKERNIIIFELPSYSPELNLIKILWRFMKYQCIEIDAYCSWETFVGFIEKIL
jgi:transposase